MESRLKPDPSTRVATRPGFTHPKALQTARVTAAMMQRPQWQNGKQPLPNPAFSLPSPSGPPGSSPPNPRGLYDSDDDDDDNDSQSPGLVVPIGDAGGGSSSDGDDESAEPLEQPAGRRQSPGRGAGEDREHGRDTKPTQLTLHLSVSRVPRAAFCRRRRKRSPNPGRLRRAGGKHHHRDSSPAADGPAPLTSRSFWK